jgi:hypothetical protein
MNNRELAFELVRVVKDLLADTKQAAMTGKKGMKWTREAEQIEKAIGKAIADKGVS